VSAGLERRAAASPNARWHGWVATGLVVVGALRIAATYGELSETVDEVAHIGAGMEWLALGRYTFELQHPPLARIVAATGPYLLGIRSQGQSNLWDEGRRVLYADGAYRRNLTAARLGVLPFFFLAAFFVWRIGRSTFGPAAALGAVACFTLLPSVLAHFGVATTDGPMLAMFAWSIDAMIRWLREPNVATGLGLGVATALAAATKFSAVPFLGVVALALAAARFAAGRRVVVPENDAALGVEDRGDRQVTAPWPWLRALGSLAVAGAAGFIVMWTIYRFSIGVVRGIPMPLAEIPKGIRAVADHNRYGHPAYFLGVVRAHGVWYFFPVMMALKTPLAALLLGGAGFAVLLRRARRTREWEALVPIAVVSGVLVVAMVANINIGLRHVLPVYLGIALGASVGWQWAWDRWTNRAARVGLVAATALLSVGTVTIHPDYLAYFNVLAGREPSRLVADSDLDWGQDMLRLAREVKQRGVDTLKFAYIGTADLSPIIGVPVRYWDGEGRPEGWVAISETWYRRGQIAFRRGAYEMRPEAMFWLDSAASFTRVGKGVRLYRIPPTVPLRGARP
jgi:hypothetical protein